MVKNWRVVAPLRLMCGEQKIFGPGVARLLTGIQQNGSIRHTAADMGMSYSKAWSVLRACEKELGFALLHRQAGGVHGGGAQLTEMGEQMLKHYEAFADDARSCLESLLQKHFGGQINGE